MGISIIQSSKQRSTHTRMSRQDEWDDENEQPQQVPAPGTVEYWSYVLREQRRASQRQRQQELNRRVNNRLQCAQAVTAIEQQVANMRIEE